VLDISWNAQLPRDGSESFFGGALLEKMSNALGIIGR
jgi:hypothetical protein